MHIFLASGEQCNLLLRGTSGQDDDTFVRIVLRRGWENVRLNQLRERCLAINQVVLQSARHAWQSGCQVLRDFSASPRTIANR